MDPVVVEHIFITTLEPFEAIKLVAELLGRHRFVAEGKQGFAVTSNLAPSATFVRPKKSQFMRLSNNNLLNRAQKVRLDFDRGRVTVAVAMDDAAAGDFTITSRGSLFGRGRRKRLADLQQAYLVGIATGLESSVGRRESSDVADRHIKGPATAITDLARRQTRNALIILGVIVLVVAALITIGVIYGNSHR